MALCCFHPQRELKDEMWSDLNDAFGQYQKAADLQRAGLHRDAYLWYIKAMRNVQKFQTTYRHHRNLKLKDKAKELEAEIAKRQPICGQFCLEELQDINKELSVAIKTQRTAYLKVTLQHVETVFDMRIHEKNLSLRQWAAIFPDTNIEYSDDSEDDRYYNCPEVGLQISSKVFKCGREEPKCVRGQLKTWKTKASYCMDLLAREKHSS